MADENENFPVLPARQWWAIRERFKRSMPAVVTSNYLETTLQINANTARDLIVQLKYLKLLDSDGKPSDIAEDWRHDDTYAKACKEIRDTVYPDELRHAAPDPIGDRAAVERWFARRKKVGENAALKMAITYQLAASADLQKAPDPAKASPRKDPQRTRGNPTPAKSQLAVQQTPNPAPAQTHSTTGIGGTGTPSVAQRAETPSLHIDVQIHIAADASTAQIDQIFASMAKHLYQRGTSKNE